MRPLFPPSDERVSPRTEQMMNRLLQNNIATGPQSDNHALMDGRAILSDKNLSRFLRSDPRPWKADTRQVGSVEQADTSRPEVSWHEMVYGAPSQMQLAHRRTYPYTAGSGSGIVKNGAVIEAAGVDRAVETENGLYVQAGGRLYHLTQDGGLETVGFSNRAAGAADRWTLVSGSEDQYELLVGEPQKTIDVGVQVEGTDIRLQGTGHFEVTLTYTGVSSISDGEDVTQLPNYNEALNLYNADGDRLAYTISGGNISVGSVLESSAIEGTGSGYLLYYEAVVEYDYQTPAGVPAPEGEPRSASISFTDAAETMHRLPDGSNIEAHQVVDLMCEVPVDTGRVRVDEQGFVGDVSTAHPISGVMASRHQVAVAGGSGVSVVEPAAGRTILHQRFPNMNIVGATWTKNVEMGIVAATSSGFEVYGLVPDHRVRSGPYQPAENRIS